jgi:hypothetical protein
MPLGGAKFCNCNGRHAGQLLQFQMFAVEKARSEGRGYTKARNEAGEKHARRGQ